MVKEALAVAEPNVAVIVAVPIPWTAAASPGLADPAVPIVASEVLDELQVTADVRFKVLPSL